MTEETDSGQNDLSRDQANKIQALREMIQNAEKTIQGARAMLLSIEGKKKTGRPKKLDNEDEGVVVQGTFDGQFMMGTDGKQYPVPANYASKSKLVEGDMLKLTITDGGSFIYKQIGPVDRRHAIGIVVQDDRGNYLIVADGKPFRVLLASITYFKLAPGDEVAIVLPNGIETEWAAVENVTQKAPFVSEEVMARAKESLTRKTDLGHWKEGIDDTSPSEAGAGTAGSVDPNPDEAPSAGTDVDFSSGETGTVTPEADATGDAADRGSGDSRTSVLDDWIHDMEEIEREMQQGRVAAKQASSDAQGS